MTQKKNLAQKERIIELLKDKDVMTLKQIKGFTGYPKSSIRSVMSQGEKAGTFKRLVPGCYRLA